MVSSVEEARKYGEFTSVGAGTDGSDGVVGARGAAGGILPGGLTALSLAEKFWPGPLTLVLPRRQTLPMFLNAGIESVGIRCPGNNFCLDLIKAFGGPLTTTSANLTTWPEVYEVETYLHQLAGGQIQPDLVLDGGILSKRKPSTIIGFKGRDLELIREGELWVYIKDSA